MTELTRLTKTDLQAIETEVNMLAGPSPTAESVMAEMDDSRWLRAALDFIAGIGRVVTLAIVEFVQAVGALVLAVMFVFLEADRVYHGTMALGQHTEAALLVAVVLTSMNFVLPIYHLRNVTNQDELTRVRWTVRGHLESFWRRLTGRPQTYQVDVYSNPALSIAETAVTWATLSLAFFAVLGPMLEQYADSVWYAAIWAIVSGSSITQMLSLTAGLLLSVGGVFAVQSISHELATRLILERPERMTVILERRRMEHEQRVEQLRAEVQARFMAAKLADLERVKAEKEATVNPTLPPVEEEDTQPAVPVSA
jgi:hypothetical protein